jgi:hypothetical protein
MNTPQTPPDEPTTLKRRNEEDETPTPKRVKFSQTVPVPKVPGFIYTDASTLLCQSQIVEISVGHTHVAAIDVDGKVCIFDFPLKY